MITNNTSVLLDAVSFARGENSIFEDFSLALRTGEHLALLGSNGSGKSTLLDLISGAVTPDAGSVRRHGSRYAFVPQRSSLNSNIPMTAYKAVAMGRWALRRPWRRLTPADQHAINNRIAQLELSEVSAKQLTELSGGQRQRVFIAQALVQEAPLILLDEPEAGLDSSSKHIVQRALADEVARGTTVVIATHDLHSARMASRCVILRGSAGGIVADGHPEDVLTEATLARAFL